jgi:quercetin dioxygenase-like cupin family protein
MTEKPGPLVVESAEVEASPIQIPGATPEGIEAQLLNIDLDRGIVATIIHFKPGAAIPAHYHRNGAEAHYVLEGELIDGERRCGPGTYLTHAAGVVHGPHRSEQGCRVLTIQGGKLAAGDTDFHLADSATATRGAPEGARSRPT